MFKVGDLIAGINSDTYLYTGCKMTKGEVVGIKSSDRMIVKVLENEFYGQVGKTFDVLNSDLYFKLIKEEESMKNFKVTVSEEVKTKVASDRPAFNHKMIKNVARNGIATIVFWKDGTKTVVKAHDEDLDQEKALAMAIVKKLSGNNFDYYTAFKKWCDNASDGVR